jgi:hypothetical protein
VRVTKPSGRVVLIAYRPPEELEFLRLFVSALHAVVPGFQGIPDDPPPLEFQVADPEVLGRRLTNAGLRDVEVVPSAERNAFRSGQQLWDWLINSNPIAGMLVEDLDDGQRATLGQVLDGMIRERLDGDGPAILSNAVNIGIGRK